MNDSRTYPIGQPWAVDLLVLLLDCHQARYLRVSGGRGSENTSTRKFACVVVVSRVHSFEN